MFTQYSGFSPAPKRRNGIYNSSTPTSTKTQPESAEEKAIRPTTPKRNLIVGSSRAAVPVMNKSGASWLASPTLPVQEEARMVQQVYHLPSFEETWNPLLVAPSPGSNVPAFGRRIVGSAFSQVSKLIPEETPAMVSSSRKRVRFDDSTHPQTATGERSIKRKKIEGSGFYETPSKVIHEYVVKSTPPTSYRPVAPQPRSEVEDTYQQAPKSVPGMALRIMSLLDDFTNPYHKFKEPEVVERKPEDTWVTPMPGRLASPTRLTDMKVGASEMDPAQVARTLDYAGTNATPTQPAPTKRTRETYEPETQPQQQEPPPKKQRVVELLDSSEESEEERLLPPFQHPGIAHLQQQSYRSEEESSDEEEEEEEGEGEYDRRPIPVPKVQRYQEPEFILSSGEEEEDKVSEDDVNDDEEQDYPSSDELSDSRGDDSSKSSASEETPLNQKLREQYLTTKTPGLKDKVLDEQERQGEVKRQEHLRQQPQYQCEQQPQLVRPHSVVSPRKHKAIQDQWSEDISGETSSSEEEELEEQDIRQTEQGRKPIQEERKEREPEHEKRDVGLITEAELEYKDQHAREPTSEGEGDANGPTTAHQDEQPREAAQQRIIQVPEAEEVITDYEGEEGEETDHEEEREGEVQEENVVEPSSGEGKSGEDESIQGESEENQKGENLVETKKQVIEDEGETGDSGESNREVETVDELRSTEESERSSSGGEISEQDVNMDEGGAEIVEIILRTETKDGEEEVVEGILQEEIVEVVQQEEDFEEGETSEDTQQDKAEAEVEISDGQQKKKAEVEDAGEADQQREKPEQQEPADTREDSAVSDNDY